MPPEAPLDGKLTVMRTDTKSQLESARALLLQLNTEQANVCIADVLQAEPGNLDAHNLRELYRMPGCFADWMGVNTQISADDDIFRFFANHPSSKNPIRDYLADGWRTMMELQEALGAVDRPLWKCQRFLEFASGHGRFTRHLARVFTDGQLTVSDVAPGTVEYLQRTLGVNGFYSRVNPEEVNFPERYDVIFVLSLFSHLPISAWAAWQRKLHSALAPGGVLIFSTHGVRCASLEGVNFDAEGVRFFPSSESSALDGETYGTTFASADVVQSLVKEALGPKTEVQVIPSHFWGNQDAILVLAH